MSSLSASQRWVIVSFIAAILLLGTTFFLEGDVRTFAYVVISMGVGLYAVLSQRDNSEKGKRSGG